MGAVGGESCSGKNTGPSNVNVELLSPAGALISSVLTLSDGHYMLKDINPGMKFLSYFLITVDLQGLGLQIGF